MIFFLTQTFGRTTEYLIGPRSEYLSSQMFSTPAVIQGDLEWSDDRSPSSTQGSLLPSQFFQNLLMVFEDKGMRLVLGKKRSIHVDKYRR